MNVNRRNKGSALNNIAWDLDDNSSIYATRKGVAEVPR